ncbi:hypothetical protein [Mangrovibacterium marinum]|uniref:MORN repeat protein n=1 Tax=Mangrovibacterium marinum TaxID=1639118 RepID=A0A2T5C0Q1_9BACT|nr:hypothetical protein [Mangrovibacterium marinum]PTN08173.1 hypothetical protein C8N47_11059 [Mangrovibacterium marinum]
MEMTRKGNCLNFSNCSKADRKEIIEVGVTEDFICPECESELIDIPAKKSGGKKGLVIIGAAAILALIGGGAFFALSGNQDEEILLDEPIQSVLPTETQTPEKAPVPQEIQAPAEAQEPAQSNSSLSLGFGNYKGETKNGKAHGMGTLYYTQHHLISTRDRQERYAAQGDYLVGEFYNGEIVQGKLYDKDNKQKETIIVGRPN